MYAPFEGGLFLSAYHDSRMRVLQRSVAGYQGAHFDSGLAADALLLMQELLAAASPVLARRFRELLGDRQSRGAPSCGRDALAGLAEELKQRTISTRNASLDLLHNLMAVQLVDGDFDLASTWLDRLIQRFEVTKKIYEFYPQGFRKGEGSNCSIRLYWLFALALSLFWARSNKLRYLSTLLKVCDLLCSLPEEMLQPEIPRFGLSMVLAAELVAVESLAAQKGVPLGSV
jgi:hypothetical protein